jgi:hypothetical protein
VHPEQLSSSASRSWKKHHKQQCMRCFRAWSSSSDGLFNIDAGIVMYLVTACAKYCPNVSESSSVSAGQQGNAAARWQGSKQSHLTTACKDANFT